MSKKPNPKVTTIHVPKDILKRVRLGQSFAEYDRVLLKQGVIVKTPAMTAAEDDSRSKCFFVGRRGTGKTAIARYLSNKANITEIHPEIFSTVGNLLDPAKLRDTRQSPVRALVACLRRSLICEVIGNLSKLNKFQLSNLPTEFRSERTLIEQHTFDTRCSSLITDAFGALDLANQRDYLRMIDRSKMLLRYVNSELSSKTKDNVVIIDRIDDSWDGTDTAVVLLMALMHACLDIATSGDFCRPMLFVRENVFDRVREIDTEFSRLQPCVESLEWTNEQLIELIERRLILAFPTKPAIGEVWDYIFDRIDGNSSRDMVLAFCQKRPRDLIRFCMTAIDAAVSRLHEHVTDEDIREAKRQFSMSSLKDLADEYCENYPQLHLVLSRFHGLSDEFTLPAIHAFIKKLIVDSDVKRYCIEWIYRFTTPSLFVELLWSIGFWGIRKGGNIEFRGLGAIASSPPSLSGSDQLVIHPSFCEALDLQQGKVLGDLDLDVQLQTGGLLQDIPEALRLDEYVAACKATIERLDSCQQGTQGAKEYEEIVGEVIRLCFFRALLNVEPRTRDYEGRVIRDWIAANRAEGGFWDQVREQYGANQVIWECKNYSKLKADDFHQISYYINNRVGRFVVCCFRGERDEASRNAPHLRRISTDRHAIVLLLNDQDLKTFLRQAIRGKVKEDHIHERLDKTLRLIS